MNTVLERMEQAKPRRAKRTGPRPSAANQRGIIVGALRQAADRGVDNLTFVFQYHISQAPARVWELRKAGWIIDSVPNRDDGTVRYVLRGEPAATAALNKTNGDFFEGQRATGLPLFDAVMR